MIKIKIALRIAVNQLKPYVDSAAIDAEVLLAAAMEKSRAYLYANPDALVSDDNFKTFQDMLTKRSLGVPIAYLTGEREFWSLPLRVNQETLIPRPETELLVELALSILKQEPKARVLDLGTGSGAIALALAHERVDWLITACDCSVGALVIAKENAMRLGLFNIKFYHSNWFSNIDSSILFHAIISNPPYIASNDPHLYSGDLRFEPKLALVGGSSGLSALEHIIENSIKKLEPGGLLLIEHGFDQRKSVSSMLYNYGYTDIQSWQDIHGHDRVTAGIKNK